MRVEMSKKYRTRDGETVRILCTDRPDRSYPIIALTGEGGWHLVSYTSGGYYSSGGLNSHYDLVEVTEWGDFQVDEPVMVRDKDDSEWERRYFAGVTKEGQPSTWRSGVTSWTNMDGCPTSCWDECRRPTEEELKSD